MKPSQAQCASLTIDFINLRINEKDKRKYLVEYSISYDNTKGMVELAIIGAFHFDDGLEDKTAMIAWVNGATILYGIARTTVSMMTSQSFNSVMLPTVMMDKLIQEFIKNGAQQGTRDTASIEKVD